MGGAVAGTWGFVAGAYKLVKAWRNWTNKISSALTKGNLNANDIDEMRSYLHDMRRYVLNLESDVRRAEQETLEIKKRAELETAEFREQLALNQAERDVILSELKGATNQLHELRLQNAEIILGVEHMLVEVEKLKLSLNLPPETFSGVDASANALRKFARKKVTDELGKKIIEGQAIEKKEEDK